MITSWVLVLLWMLLIIFLSSQPAKSSNRLSKNLTVVILTEGEKLMLVKPGTSRNVAVMNKLNNVLRDCAHALIYLVSAMLLYNAISISGVRGAKSAVWSFFLCMAFAASDETHQRFVSGRGMELSDFLLDCTGIVAGLVVYGLFRQAFIRKSVVEGRFVHKGLYNGRRKNVK